MCVALAGTRGGSRISSERFPVLNTAPQQLLASYLVETATYASNSCWCAPTTKFKVCVIKITSVSRNSNHHPPWHLPNFLAGVTPENHHDIYLLGVHCYSYPLQGWIKSHTHFPKTTPLMTQCRCNFPRCCHETVPSATCTLTFTFA